MGGDGRRYPLFSRPPLERPCLPVATPAIAVRLGYGSLSNPLAVVPLHAILFVRVERRRHLRRQERGDLLERVRSVRVVIDDLLYHAPVPLRLARGRRHSFSEQAGLYCVLAKPVRCQPEHLLHHCHLRLANDQSVPRFVVAEPVGRSRHHHPSLPGLAQHATTSPLRDLCPLVLGELVEDAVGQFPLRAVVPTVIKGSNFGAVLLELPPQEVVISWLAGEAVPILRQHHRYSATSHEVPHAVHAWPLKACAALPGVLHPLEDLVTFSGGGLAEGFYLLGEGVA